jgi:heme-degrading monooxygenase HmoA
LDRKKENKFMVSRHWTGTAKKERAEEYILHFQNDTFKQLETIAGFVSAQILKREVKEGIEFLVITNWQSIDAIRQFAGDQTDTAVVPQLVQDIMTRYDQKVRHYEVI